MSESEFTPGRGWVLAIDGNDEAQKRRIRRSAFVQRTSRDVNVERLKLRRFSWQSEGA